MLIEKISQNEIDMMDEWRNMYAWSNYGQSINSTVASIPSILKEWEIQKSTYLEKMFGGELILTKNLVYEKSFEQLEAEVTEMKHPYTYYGRKNRSGHEFMTSWIDLIRRNDMKPFYFNLHSLVDEKSLINNIYDGPTFALPLDNGKTYKVQNGCKVSKALGKIANFFNLKGWEDFRICHSQILNQKTLGGKLTISIHPLDYMTMSDNTYDWDSCMSWEDNGSYRQGTVEMMNSRCVIVAYLSGDDKMRIGNDYWNSKKWRQLFVVDHNIIAAIKGYPYRNESLEKEIINWIRELAADRLGWHYCKPIIYSFGKNNEVHLDYLPKEKNDFIISANTRYMYNDFGCLDYHWISLSSEIDEDEIEEIALDEKCLTIEYSGACQCMICGALGAYFDDESCLVCSCCQRFHACDSCGEYAYETYPIDGIEICEACWSEHVDSCDICGEYHLDENLTRIHIIPRYTSEELTNLRTEYRNRLPYSLDDMISGKYEYINVLFNNEISICDNEICLEHWIDSYLKPNERPHIRKLYRYEDAVFVYIDQLADCAIEGYVGDVEEYIENIKVAKIVETEFIEIL